jgi:hypothetical protein
VTVSGGKVTLSGKVAAWTERECRQRSSKSFADTRRATGPAAYDH